ncbi:MAG TPA: sigma-70 family RNA polymerase sigma factor [Longimicrobiales bacterium]|nr:sigma-70 family RNA polymerase sigma factor [Longimicrobiales bacterium]
MTTVTPNEHMLHEVLRTHGPALRRVARAYAGDDGEEEDLYQEILLQLWRALPSFRGDAAPGTWSYRVALNTALAWRRSARRRTARSEQVRLDAVQAGSTPPATRTETAILREFMNALSDVDRTVLVLYMEGLDNDGIADVVGISTGAVAVRVHRMRKKFATTYVER